MHPLLKGKFELDLGQQRRKASYQRYKPEYISGDS